MIKNNINSNDLSSYLFYSPFTKSNFFPFDSTVNSTVEKQKEEFLKCLYTEPFFNLPKHPFDDENKNLDDSKEDKRYNDQYINILKTHYIDFVKDFLDYNSNKNMLSSLYVIIGSSGCGKTTFANKLFSMFPKKVLHYSNFETLSMNYINFITSIYNVDDVTPINALLLTILQRIGQLFSKPDNNKSFTVNKSNDLLIRISSIVNVYKKYFYDIENNAENNFISLNFFLHLENINDCSINNISDYILDYLKLNILNKLEYKEEKKIKELTSILLRLYFCITSLNNDNNVFLFFLDNIEHAIIIPSGEIPINNMQIKIILKAIYDAIQETDNAISMINISKKSFSIFLAMRDSTYGIVLEMLRTGSLTDNNGIKYIEISDWFDIGDVVSNRLNYLYKYNLIDENNYTIEISHGVLTYKNIISDRSQYKWGLNTFISKFYNNSKRYIAQRFIGWFLTQNEQNTCNIQYNSLVINKLEFFNYNWNEAIKLKLKEQILYDSYIQLCRKYIIRLLFDFVNNNIYELGSVKEVERQYFEEIHSIFYPSNILSIRFEQCSYARRILTYLSKKRNEKYKEEFVFVTIGELIRNILIHNSNIRDLKKHAGGISDKKLELFSDILFNLNKIRGIDTNWTGLIFIEVPDGKTFSNKNLRKYIKQAWKEYINNGGKDLDNKETVTIRVNEAGDLYSRFMPDFEYFACRYSPKSVPLLAVDNNKTLNNLLENVFTAAKKCILNISIIEKNIDDTDIKWELSNKHSNRIIDRHIGYLENFFNFLNSDICKLREKDIMKNTIIVKINEYKKLFV
ncbi:MAG: hypothetical protein FWD13_08295 [Treponema sp.]|nr:hypothetical protein [Treponema sp.]